MGNDETDVKKFHSDDTDDLLSKNLTLARLMENHRLKSAGTLRGYVSSQEGDMKI